VTDSPHRKPIGDPPLTPEQIEVWRDLMFKVTGCKGTASTNIRKILADDGWLIDNKRARELKP
jgi:hypothetical protein